MRRFVPILIAGIALIATACGDATAPARSDEASLSQFDGSSSAARNGYVGPNAKYSRIEIPARGGSVRVGDFTLYFEKDAVCDPRKSGYGPEYWDAPCKPHGKDIKLFAAVWMEGGQPHVEFLADLRFDPTKVVLLALTLDSFKGLDRSPVTYHFTRDRLNRVIVDYSEQVATHFDSRSGTVTSRIKHFSGYVVASGRCEEDPSAPECNNAP